MTRKKVKLHFITNDSSRKITFMKRKKCLLNKINELSTLCGIDACLIIYSPYDSGPEVWPSPMEAQRIIAGLKKMAEIDQNKYMVNQEIFIRENINKANKKLNNLRNDNREKEITLVMFDRLVYNGHQNQKMVDMYDLNSVIDLTLEKIYNKMEILQKGTMAVAEQQGVQVEQMGVIDDINGQNQNYQMAPTMTAEDDPQYIDDMVRELFLGDIMSTQVQAPGKDI